MKRRSRNALHCAPLVLCAALFAACGGGGGGGKNGDDEPLPVVFGQAGPGDPESYFPLGRGDEWQYEAAVTEEGAATQTSRVRLEVGPLRSVGDTAGTVLARTDMDTGAVLADSVVVVVQSGVAELGGAVAGFGPVGPYWLMRFPLEPGDRFVQVARAGLDLGQDLDGDGRSEAFDLRSVATVLGLETITVPAGTFARCAKLQTVTDVTVTGSSARQTVTAKVVSTAWYAPGMGLVRLSEAFTVDGRGVETTALELTGYFVNGAQGGDYWRGERPWRVEASPREVDVSVGGSIQLQSTAWSRTAQLHDLPVVWRSADPAVATVSRDGVVTGVATGTTEVFASTNGVQSYPVTVRVVSGRILQLAANHLVHDPHRGRIYASVPSRQGPGGNSVAIIDPAAGKVVASLPAGSEPKRLALSDDGRFLYVALDGAGKVVRFDLTASGGPAMDLTIDLTGGGGVTGAYGVGDMEVVPGSPGTLAISLRSPFSYAYAGVAIYDGATKRPKMSPFNDVVDQISFTGPSTFYGLSRGVAGLLRMTIDSSGVAASQFVPMYGVFLGAPADYEYATGRLYTTSGEAVDLNSSSLAGRFSIGALGLVEPDLQHGLVFFLSAATDGSPSWELQAFDAQTFVPVASRTLLIGYGRPADLVRWGARGLAFRSENDAIVFLDDAPGIP